MTSTPAEPVRITARRAYAEVLGLFVAVFGTGVALAGLSLGATLPQVTHLSWAEASTDAFQEIGTAALVVAVAVLAARNRGLSARDLGFVLPARTARRSPTTRLLTSMSAAAAALILGALVINALKTGENNVVPHSFADVVFGVGASINAGFVEETVVVGFLVATLTQARRPLPEIVAVALVLRASYHIYYGPGVLGVLVWASIFLWIYFRTRSLVPLIVVHVFWDVMAFSVDAWRRSSGWFVLVVVVLWVVAGTCALIERSRPEVVAYEGPPTAPAAPPGWTALPPPNEGGPPPSGGFNWPRR